MLAVTGNVWPQSQTAPAGDALSVTITPKPSKKVIEDFRDAYVDLGGGKFIRFSDWITRGLNKSDLGAGKSELDEMIARGDVAAALMGEKFEKGGDANIGMVIGGQYKKMSFEQIAVAFGVDLLARQPGAPPGRGFYGTGDPNVLYDPGTFMLGDIDFSGYPSLLDYVNRNRE